MWEFLKSLPVVFSFTIILLAIIAVVIVSIIGRFKAKIGDKTVIIGDDKSDDTCDTTTIPKPARTTITAKRGCGDCILVIMAEREKYELKFRGEKDRVLKTQMVFAEHKIIEIQTLLMKNLLEKISAATRAYDESVQYKLILGIIKDAFVTVKNELRRSFKDNGFHDLYGSELSVYTKNETNGLINIIIQHVQNIYPDNDNILEISEIIKTTIAIKSDIEPIVHDIYTNAKDTKEDVWERIVDIQKQFCDWVDNFIG